MASLPAPPIGMRRRRISPSLALLLAATVPAQSQWASQSVMWPRSFHAMVHDPVTGVVRVFGGGQANVDYATTWALSATGWTETDTMPASGQVSAVYDPVRDRCYVARNGGLFSSWDRAAWHIEPSPPTTLQNADHHLVFDPVAQRTTLVLSAPTQTELWDFDGANWTQRAMTGPSPPWNVNGRVMYEPATGAILSLTAFPPGTPLQIWAFQGASWQQRITATSPPPLEWFAAGRDPITSDLLVFGGYVSQSGFAVTQNQLWAYGGLDWRLVATPQAPPPRHGHALVNDTTNGRLLLYGGHTFTGGQAQWLGETWAWDGAVWSQIAEPNAPALRGTPGHRLDAEVVFDRGRQEIVAMPTSTPGTTQTFDGNTWRSWSCGGTCPQQPVYLGFDESLQLPIALAPNGAFVFAGHTWVQLQPAGGPSPMPVDAALAWDGTRLVLFGGIANVTPTNATWAWDVGGWTQLFPATSPPPMAGHQLVGMPSRGGALLLDSVSTWWWNGTTWQPSGPSPAPGIAGVALAYLPERDRIVAHGGVSQFGSVANTTREWDGIAWQTVAATSSPARAFHWLVEGPAQRLWLMPEVGLPLHAYRSVDQAECAPYGPACLGSAGRPRLSTQPWQRPRLGDPFLVELDQLPNAGALLALGFRDDQWGGLPLPLLLDFAGMFGCHALLEPDSLFSAAVTAGHASWTFVVPPVPAFVGITCFLQGIAIDHVANPTGLTTSNGLRLRLGRR